MALCLIGAGEAVRLAIAAFSLSWIHTVEKVPWEESWRVEATRLVLSEARVKGSGAGMEPPPNARHQDGWYIWEPENPERGEIILRMTEFGQWTFCAEGISCRPLRAVFGRDADPITIKPCG